MSKKSIVYNLIMFDSLLTAYWIKIFATLAIFIALMVLFFRNGNKQTHGEDTSSLKAKIKKLGEEYTLLSGVVVPALRGMSQIDHVIVSPYGIFVLTVINESGKVSGRTRDGEWEIKSGRRRDVLYNPLWENRKWVNALENHQGPQPFIPVVVFTRARLKSDFGKNVIPLSRLPGYIKKHDKSRLFSDKLEGVLQKLKSSDAENQ
ncbi:MAG: NERD domain-containing protein [Nitrospinae bacterium]|nr:NERD domain-containing protein [Nitrospinota bacterium]